MCPYESLLLVVDYPYGGLFLFLSYRIPESQESCLVSVILSKNNAD